MRIKFPIYTETLYFFNHSDSTCLSLFILSVNISNFLSFDYTFYKHQNQYEQLTLVFGQMLILSIMFKPILLKTAVIGLFLVLQAFSQTVSSVTVPIVSSSTASSSASPESPTISPTDTVSPNPQTLSNSLKTNILTTNPTSSTIYNTGFYNYQAATTAFTSLSQLNGGATCQNSLKYVAFRQYSTQFYLTPNMYFLSLASNSSPSQQQLFTAFRNSDNTWSFRTVDGLYLSLNTAFSYVTLSNILSVGERFYLQRKQDWIYIQSANSYRYFWQATNGILLYGMNKASRFVMEFYPDLEVGWN